MTDTIATPPSNGWEPIETAPKDGKDILLANRFGAWSSAWAGDDWRSYYYSEPPTHWMHLPAPPVESPTESGVMEGLPPEPWRVHPKFPGVVVDADDNQVACAFVSPDAAAQQRIAARIASIPDMIREIDNQRSQINGYLLLAQHRSAEIERLRNVAANAALDGLETTIGAANHAGDLAAENAALRERIKELEAAMGYQESFALKVENAALRERIAELEAKAAKLADEAEHDLKMNIGEPGGWWSARTETAIAEMRALLPKAQPEPAP